MFQTKFAEKIKTHIWCSSFSESRAVDEVLWKNTVELARPPVTVRHGTCG